MKNNMHAHQEMIEVEGVPTAVTKRMSPGPVLLGIHGNSLSRQIFAPLWNDPRFTDYSLVTYDLPGHGDSERPERPEETYSFSGYARHLASLVQILGLDDFIIMGHSLGGHIALQAAVEFGLPGLGGLFLMGTPPWEAPKIHRKRSIPSPRGHPSSPAP